MSKSINPADLPDGQHYLIFDSSDNVWPWALYKAGRSSRYHICMVDWAGDPDDPIEVNALPNDGVHLDRFDVHTITPEQADAVVMAAMHLPSKGAWYLFLRAAREARGGIVSTPKPRTEPFPDSIPADQHYLALDGRDGSWSLWRRSPDCMIDYMLVAWSGHVENPPEVSYEVWDQVRYWTLAATPDDASLIIMGARHLTTRDSWRAFAQRFADRIRNRDPSCQMV